MRRLVQLLAALLATVVALVGVAGGGVALAQEDDDGPNLSVRAIDARDPDEATAEFVWTGDRDQVPELVVRENGEVIESGLPVRLDQDGVFGVVLAIDTSGSMTEDAALERAQEAAKEFVANKADSDQIAVVGFGSDVQVVSQFTDDTGDLEDAIDGIGVADLGDTKLYDALVESANLFEGTEFVPNVVLLSDGGDRGSTADREVAESRLDESGALLYAIGLETGDLDEDALEALAEGTGGQVLSSPEPGDLDEVYAEAQDALREQYRVEFVSEAEREGPSQLTLTVGATSGSASFTPGARLDTVRQVEPVPVAESGGVEFLQSGVFLWLAIGLVLLAVAGAAFAVGSSIATDRDGLDRLLQPYSDGFVAPDEDDDRLATSAILQRAVEMTGDFAERRGLLQRVEDMLERANLPLRAAEAIFFYVVAAVLVMLLAGFASGSIVVGLIVLAFAILLPPVVISYLANRRRTQFQEQLPDVLGLLASTLRSGFSLMQGVEATVREVPEPTKRELGRVVSESRLGMPLEEALENMAKRMNSRDFEWAVMAIGIQRQVGGNLAELLDIVSETMRERERLRRDIKSLTAEGRVSALVLGVLPVGIGLVIYALSPDYIEGMFDETIGVIMVIAAGGLMLVGFYWMYKIIDIEV